MFGSATVDLSGYLTDVQTNGTSIVENGVANVPIASTNKLGVVKVSSSYGTGMLQGGIIEIIKASSSDIKKGTHNFKPIVCDNQHEATFYGLAKASGDITQSTSSNTVGNYTEDAKSSIQNMLGITDKYSPKEWVAESETELVTNAHNIGDLFYISETLYKVIADLNAGDAINVGVNVEEVDVNDILDDYATKEDVENNVSIVEKETSGAIITIDDGAENSPLKKMIVDINPVQNLNGYNHPWVGGGGKNLFNLDNAVLAIGYNGAYRKNGYHDVTVYKTETGIASDEQDNNCGRTVCLGLLPAGDYIVSFADNSYLKTKMSVVYTNTNILPENESLSRTTVADTTTQDYIEFEADGVNYYWLGSYANNAAPYKIDNIMVRLASVADATYEPYKNICPISGWTEVNIPQMGKNLLPLNIWNGFNYNSSVGTVFAPTLSDRSWTQGENSITYETTATYTALSLMTPLLRKGVYYISLHKLSANSLRYTRYVLDKSFTVKQSNYVSNVTNASLAITLDEDGYIAFRLDNGSTASQTVEITIQVEVGDTETTYEPYKGRIINVSWEDEAGTVYGGTLDMVDWMLRAEMADVDLGTLTWTYQEGYHRFNSSGIASMVKIPSSNNVNIGGLCSAYVVRSVSQVILNDNGLGVSTSGTIGIIDTRFTDPTEFKAAVDGVHYVYPLATPIEYQLTPQQITLFKNYNALWADTGDISEFAYFSQVDEDLTDYIKANLNSYAKKDLLNNYVDDVQINGTSIVTNNVANVPIATQNVIGALYTASESDGKVGTHTYRAIVPKVQHSSVFYGLAKAAGVDMASSSNEVGTYTESAKSAISDMLNGAIQISGTDPTIIAKSGIRYVCGEVLSLNFTPSTNGICDVMFTSGSTPTVLTLPDTVKMPEWFSIEANTTYEINIADGIYGAVTSWTV